MTYYLALADATIARTNDEIETHIIGGFDTVEDARVCLLKMIRHALFVLYQDPDDYYKNLDDEDAIEVFDKENRLGYWLIEEGIQSPEDFVSNYHRRRVLISGDGEVPPQGVEVAPVEDCVRLRRAAIPIPPTDDPFMDFVKSINSDAEIAALKDDIAATLARLQPAFSGAACQADGCGYVRQPENVRGRKESP